MIKISFIFIYIPTILSTLYFFLLIQIVICYYLPFAWRTLFKTSFTVGHWWWVPLDFKQMRKRLILPSFLKDVFPGHISQVLAFLILWHFKDVVHCFWLEQFMTRGLLSFFSLNYCFFFLFLLMAALRFFFFFILTLVLDI